MEIHIFVKLIGDMALFFRVPCSSLLGKVKAANTAVGTKHNMSMTKYESNKSTVGKCPRNFQVEFMREQWWVWYFQNEFNMLMLYYRRHGGVVFNTNA